MNKAEIAQQLNEGCCYKNEKGFNEWTECDVDFDPVWNGRSYCYWWFKDYKLCWNCQEVIDKYTNRSLIESGELVTLRAQVKELTKEIAKLKAHLHLE